MTDKKCLLCGDPQQPSEYMYRRMKHLEDQGVVFSRMEYKGNMKPIDYRELTMEMESRGPDDYKAPEIIENAKDAEILVVHKAPVSRMAVESCNNLRVVGCSRGGYENVNVETARENDVTVLHAPGRNRNAVADYAFGLVIASVRNIPRFSSSLKKGDWEMEFDPEKLPFDMEGKKLGIIGFGNVGRGVTKRATGFGMEILVSDPYAEDEEIREAGAKPVDLEILLRTSHVVSLHARLTDETENLIDEEELGMMKDSAYLINTARGGLINEDALVAALEGDEISGAALDVFKKEPIDPDHALVDLDNTILSPHIAGSTKDAVLNGPSIIGAQIESILKGEKPEHSL